MKIWALVGGERVAIDKLYKIIVNNIVRGEVYASPHFEHELAIGYLASQCYPRNVLESADVTVDGHNILVRIRDQPETVCRKVPMRTHINIDTIKKLTHLIAVASKVVKRLGLTLHTGILYSIDNGSFLLLHDVSRYSLVEKLVGIAIRRNKQYHILIFTSRVSTPIVRAASVAGIEMIATWRHAVYGEHLGITLVGIRGERINTITHSGRLKL